MVPFKSKKGLIGTMHEFTMSFTPNRDPSSLRVNILLLPPKNLIGSELGHIIYWHQHRWFNVVREINRHNGRSIKFSNQQYQKSII